MDAKVMPLEMTESLYHTHGSHLNESPMGGMGIGAQRMRKPNFTTAMRPSTPTNNDQSLDDSPEQGAYANGFMNGDGSVNFPNDMWQSPEGNVYLNTDPSDISEFGGAQYWLDQIDHFLASIPDMIRHWVLIAGGGEDAYNQINEWWISWYQTTKINVELLHIRQQIELGDATAEWLGWHLDGFGDGIHNLGALYNQYYGDNP